MVQQTPAASFLDDIARLEARVASPGATSAEIVATCSDIYAAVAAADFSRYDAAAVRKASPELMQRLFDLRMALRSGIPAWHAADILKADARRGLRDCFRVLRYASDMLGEHAIGYQRIEKGGTTRRGFTGRDMNTLTNRAFDVGSDLPFRTGDVIMVRGMAHNSAAIARIGDVDSQFSHVGMVYVGPDGRHWMVEALIEDGAIINTLEHALDHGIGRAVVYRHRDAALAAKAAAAIHEHVRRSRTALGRRILYDFSMRLDRRRRLFCSKLVRLAFQMASDGKVQLPTYRTRLIMTNRDFIQRIGVSTSETFVPHDMDLEPDFDLVAEWQDYRVTSDLRLQDFVMDKFFEWMDTRSYRFHETMQIRLISWFGRFAATLSEGVKDMIKSVIPKVPIHMRRKAIAAVAMLHKTAEPVYHELQRLEREHIAATGHCMHGRQVFEHLERIRAAAGTEIGYLRRGG